MGSIKELSENYKKTGKPIKLGKERKKGKVLHAGYGGVKISTKKLKESYTIK